MCMYTWFFIYVKMKVVRISIQITVQYGKQNLSDDVKMLIKAECIISL